MTNPEQSKFDYVRLSELVFEHFDLLTLARTLYQARLHSYSSSGYAPKIGELAEKADERARDAHDKIMDYVQALERKLRQ